MIILINHSSSQSKQLRLEAQIKQLHENILEQKTKYGRMLKEKDEYILRQQDEFQQKLTVQKNNFHKERGELKDDIKALQVVRMILSDMVSYKLLTLWIDILDFGVERTAYFKFSGVKI
jgi:hypothetical protein